MYADIFDEQEYSLSSTFIFNHMKLNWLLWENKTKTKWLDEYPYSYLKTVFTNNL